MDRASACGAEGRWFDPSRGHQQKPKTFFRKNASLKFRKKVFGFLVRTEAQSFSYMDQETKEILISKEVFQKLPGLIVISGIAELDSAKTPDIAGIKSYLEQSWEKLRQKTADENSEEFKRIRQWSDSLKVAGISTKKFPPSIQAIAKRAAKGGAPFSINPIVDCYNAISMDLALPLGAYDASGFSGSLRLRISPGAEKFIALGSNENDPTLPDEIVYSDQDEILTRMFLWRQSNKAKLGSDTKRFIFVCELLDAMAPAGLKKQVQELIVQKMQSLLGARVTNVSIQARL